MIGCAQMSLRLGKLGRADEHGHVQPDDMDLNARFAQSLSGSCRAQPSRQRDDGRAQVSRVFSSALLDRVRLPAFDSNDPRHRHLVALAAQAAAGFDAGMQERIDKAVIEVMA